MLLGASQTRIFPSLTILEILMHIDSETHAGHHGTANSANGHYRQQLAMSGVCSALHAPASKPGLRDVLTNITRCVDVIFQKEPQLAVEWADLHSALTAWLQTSGDTSNLHIAALGSISGRHRAWSLVGRLPKNAGDKTLQLLGAELLLAIRLERVVRDVPIELAWRIAMHTLEDENRAHLTNRAEKYAQRLIAELVSYCQPESRRASSRDLLYEAQVVSCLVGRSRNDDQQALNGSSISALTSIELQATLKQLVAGCHRGDVACAVQLAAFRVGLPWTLFLKIPFAHAAKPDSVIQYDASTGEVILDLARVFSDRAQVHGPAYTPTSSVLRLRMPAVSAAVILPTYCSNPDAQRLGDLLEDVKRADTFSFTINTGAIQATVARLIASAGPSAIRTGIDRGIASYMTLRFDQMGHSSHAYFNASDQEIRHAENTWLKTLDLGDASSGDQVSRVAVGAAATPTEQAVARVFNELRHQVDTAAPGRHSGLTKLFHHHDAFARLVSFDVAMCFGSRDESPMSMRAVDLTGHLSQITYQHKRVGPNLGLSVLPVPELFKAQITLWLAHLRRLLARLENVETDTAEVKQHIQDVLDGKNVPLLFLLSEGYKPIASRDIFNKIPDELHLKHDFARHFFMNAPRKHGVSQEAVEVWMRHHNRRFSSFSSISMITDEEWMSQMSMVLDWEFGSLRIRPVVGLGR